MYFNSQPHKEADLRLLFLFLSGNYFNSQPHKEADMTTIASTVPIVISTHSLTRRLTGPKGEKGDTGAFQLTASQGG